MATHSLRALLALVGASVVAACSHPSAGLGKGWAPAKWEPKDLYGPVMTVDLAQNELRYNNILLSESEVLDATRTLAGLNPPPFVYLRFSDSLRLEARRLAQEIRKTGACSEGLCIYKITEP